jgi:hypothetical protein
VPAVNRDLFHRRRAERFAQLLDDPAGSRDRVSAAGDDLAELLSVGRRLSAAAPPVEVDPEFRTSLRAMLVAAAEREGMGQAAAAEPKAKSGIERAERPAPAAGSGRPARTGRRARTRGAIIVGVAAGAIAVSGISAGSENAVPGDALYGMKRSTERAQLALANSDLNRGQLLLDFARTRVAEAAAVRGDSAGFAAVLDDMDADTRDGARLLATSAAQHDDEAPLHAIGVFVSDQREAVSSLLNTKGPVERQHASASLALLDRIAKRADDLRAALPCDGEWSGNGDELGPRPERC